MTHQQFPLRRLPDDLSLKVLETMDYYEMIVYSFVSKKAFSMVKSFLVHVSHVQIIMKGWIEIRLVEKNDKIHIFELWMPRNEMSSLDDLPGSINVLTTNLRNPEVQNIELTMSNQGMSLREWIQHFSSIFHPDVRCGPEFNIGMTRFDIQSLRDIFSNFKELELRCDQDEPSGSDILYAQNILRAFQPSIKRLYLKNVPFKENLSIQHIGIANLEELMIYSSHNIRLDNLFISNVQGCTILTDQISLRDLNRFFKLWKIGSNPKLKFLRIIGRTNVNWGVLIKGLKAEEQENGERTKEFKIRNSRGVCAQIKIRIGFLHFVEFDVSN